MNFPAYQKLGVIWCTCATIAGIFGSIYIFSNAQEFGAQIKQGFETPGQPYYLEMAGKIAALTGGLLVYIGAWYFDVYGMSNAEYLILYGFFLMWKALFYKAAYPNAI
jgi:hypothetical protein